MKAAKFCLAMLFAPVGAGLMSLNRVRKRTDHPCAATAAIGR